MMKASVFISFYFMQCLCSKVKCSAATLKFANILVKCRVSTYKHQFAEGVHVFLSRLTGTRLDWKSGILTQNY